MRTFENVAIERPPLDPKAVGNLVRGQVDRYFDNYEYVTPAIGNVALGTEAELDQQPAQQDTAANQEAGYL